MARPLSAVDRTLFPMPGTFGHEKVAAALHGATKNVSVLFDPDRARSPEGPEIPAFFAA